MCGRFNITSDPLARLLMELVNLPYVGQDNYNAAPTEMIPVVRIVPPGLPRAGEPELIPMRWWLTPYWSREMTARYSMFNAKSETAATSPAFREPFRKRRCVVPVTGFYEWCRANDQKVPYLIKSSRHGGLLLAGLWDRWVDPGSRMHPPGEPQQTDEAPPGEERRPREVLSFTILTTPANPEFAFIHTRQPVMLSIAEARRWLEPDIPTTDMTDLFGSRLPMALDLIPVSSWVNNARHKGPQAAEPAGAPIHLPGLEG